MEETAGVIAALGWRLAQQAIQRMRRAGFDIEPGEQSFDIISEYLAFILHAADRIAFQLLDADRRTQFTTALAHGLGRILGDNGEMIAGLEPAACARCFIDLANRRADDYASLSFDEGRPSFAFFCYFGNQLRERMAHHDRSWIVDHVIEIEAPEVVKALRKALPDLLAATPPQAATE
ncbi:MAG TPA: hypothetical protein VLN59_18675 [Burkholderiales bacterium]|nr:hypothetical protein [Burkholderiales bacterium]